MPARGKEQECQLSGYCAGAASLQNFPVFCRQLKLFSTTESCALPLDKRTTSRKASLAIPPFRGSAMPGQTSQIAPPSVPSTASLPSAPQPLASSSSLSSCAVKIMVVPSRLNPFFAPIALNTGAQTGSVVLGGFVNQK